MSEKGKLPLGLVPADLTALQQELANLLARSKTTGKEARDDRQYAQEPLLVIRGK